MTPTNSDLKDAQMIPKVKMISDDARGYALHAYTHCVYRYWIHGHMKC